VLIQGLTRLRTALGTGRTVPVLVFALGIAFTAVAAYEFAQLVDRQDRARFGTEVVETQAAVERKIDLQLALLRAGAALFLATERIGKGEFRAFVERLRLNELYRGVLGYGFTTRLSPAEVPEFLARRQAEGDPDFRIWPDHRRDEYHAITYIEPLNERNRAALGFDMFTEPTRRAAMERARDSGYAAASGKLALVQEIDPEHRQPGFIIYTPVFSGTGTPANAEDARRRLRGFVYSPLRAGDFLAALRPGSAAPLTAFAVFDGPVSAENLLYASHTPEQMAGTRLAEESTVDVAGRIWVIRHASLPAFEAASSRSLVAVIFILGFATSWAGGWLAGRQVAAGRQALREIERRRAVEKQQRLLLRELHHRVKNVLTVVLAIGMQSARNARSLPAFRESFAARIASLGATHDLLVQSNWSGSRLRDLLQAELGPHAAGANRCTLVGPDVELDERQTVSLGMAVHELVTNAVKYGALSIEDGRVTLGWETEQRGDHAAWLRLAWSESDGPPVTPPEQTGFGSKLIEQTIGSDLGGTVTRDFAAGGLRVVLEIPLQAPELGAA
jgi:two-component sensor histidine kinase/CHASE1-domain containing sensor protein